jgi:hypothetical protein
MTSRQAWVRPVQAPWCAVLVARCRVGALPEAGVELHACPAALAPGAARLVDPAGDFRVGVQNPRKLRDSIDHRVHRGYIITLDQHHDVRSPKERVGTDNSIPFPDLSHHPLRTWVLRIDNT